MGMIFINFFLKGWGIRGVLLLPQRLSLCLVIRRAR